jgi:Ca2+-binding EF-hand superfamily protein
MAFDVIDKDHDGEVDPEDLVGCYNASKHPDVLAGKRTEDEILREFLDTFDVGGVKDGVVTRDEFENYYANISASIDNEDYFELMIRNAWHISGGEGWAANTANKRVLVTHSDGREGVEEIKNDLGLRSNDREGMMSRLKTQGVNSTAVNIFGSAGDEPSGFTNRKGVSFGAKNETKSLGKKLTERSLGNDLDRNSLAIAEAGASSSTHSLSNKFQDIGIVGRSSTSVPNAGVSHIVQKLKTEIRARGGLGFATLQRKFRIMDDDNNKRLDLSEFKKAMKEMNMNLSDSELRVLFDYFDSDGDGSLDFEEFLQGVRDPLSDRRVRLVQMAFHKLDKDGNGMVDAEEVASAYDASKHPEVLSGRMTAKEVLRQFLETFDVGGVKDGMVTQQEFINYYANLGANIDNEDYFELMIRNAWHISGGEGWSANSANRRVLVTGADGSESVVEIKDDLGLRANDKDGMMSRLNSQGVNAKDISMYGGLDSITAPSKQAPGNFMKARSVWNTSSVGSVLQHAEHSKSASSGLSTPSQNKSLLSNSMTTVIAHAQPVALTGEALIASKGPSSVFPPPPPAGVQKPSAANHPAAIMFLINKMKTEMKSRGALGFIGLQRKFKIMDDDNSHSLSLAEFKKAMKEMNMNLSESESRTLFDYFDTNGNGSVDFEEFIQGVRDPLTDRRSKLVLIAFSKLDTDGNGIVEASEIASKYDPSRHPDVLSGRKTPNEVLTEFLDTFDVGGVKDGMVTQQEFINYYTNLGASIDNEDYFELMIRNAWHISGGEGWSANSSNKRVLVTHQDGHQTVEEIKDDLGMKANDKDGVISRLKSQGIDVLSVSFNDGIKEKGFGDTKKRFSANHFKSTIPAGVLPGTRNNEGTAPTPKVNKIAKKPLNPASIPMGIRVLIDKLKAELKVRGALGIIGLQRKFRIMDDDSNKQLDLNEFKKAMKEMNLNIADTDLRQLFDFFDSDSSGGIDFEEFIQGVRDPLSDRRLKLVKLAFNKLDKDGSGIVDAAEVASAYDASKHPEVIAGRMTTTEVMNQFLETFDVGGVKDGMVTEQEFTNYYANLGANIDNEDYFELMIRNAWHISGGEGWSANSANRRVLVTGADGNESVHEIKDDLGLRSNDKDGIMSRLKAQGVNGSDVYLYGGVDNTTAARKEGGSVPLSNLSRAGSSNASAAQKSGKAGGSKRNAPVNYGVQILLDRLKKEIRGRGSTGFLGLQRKFKIIDDDNDRMINLGEFKKAMKEMKMNLSDSELRTLFDHFDADGSGGIDFEEFIQGVRDPLSERRLSLVRMAFNKLDRDGSGIIDASEVASAYDASKHPEVIAGRMSTKDVLNQFLETFDVGGVKDGMVTQQEFINYYTNLGASIDNEDYFELMIRNAWHISGGEGWSANSANRRVLVTGADGSESVHEIKDDLGLKADDRPGMIARLRAQGTNSSQITIFGGGDYTANAKRPGTAPPSLNIPHADLKTKANRNTFDIFGNQKPTTASNSNYNDRPQTAASSSSSSSSLAAAMNKPKPMKGVEELVAMLRAELQRRGARGIVGIQRKFRIVDDDNDHSINLGEFNKAMKETGLNLNQDVRLLILDFV